jgi:hypothetical protein
VFNNTSDDILLGDGTTTSLNSIMSSIYTVNTNGHEYVDLGLPSGTLWATMNIGAESQTEFGSYFKWGETDATSD